MDDLLKQAGEIALNEARQKNIEAEAYMLYNRELSLDVHDSQVENLKEAEEIGIGIRIINNGRMGFAYSSDLSKQAVEEAVQDAINISGYMPSDPYNHLPQPFSAYNELAIYDPAIASTSMNEKIEMARETERMARAYDPRIKLVERAGYEDTEYLSMVMNTKGLHAMARGNSAALYISLVAQEENDSQNGFSVLTRRNIADLLPEQVGPDAAYRAVRSLQAKSFPSGCLPCIMEPYVVTRFMALLAPSLQGDAVLKGKSRLAGKIGEQVASAAVSIIDDASLPKGIASFPFDGEGVPAQRNSLIENGCLRAFLYDNYSGRKAGHESTGNGQRGSFRNLPSVGTSNFIMSPGSKSPEELIKDIESGLLITEVMGLHTANPISGDFSLGAAGIAIQAGQLTQAVRGITIAGNLHSLLQDIEAIGADLRYYGAKAAPSIRLNSISIAGE